VKKSLLKEKAIDKPKQLLLCKNCKEEFGNKPFVVLDSNGYYGDAFNFCCEECFWKFINEELHESVDVLNHRKYSELVQALRRCDEILLANAYGGGYRLTSLQNSIADIKQIIIQS